MTTMIFRILLSKLLLIVTLGSAVAADKITVPQGHKVEVVFPTSSAHIDFMPSGMLVIDYGKEGDWRHVNPRIDALLKERKAPLVVIL